MLYHSAIPTSRIVAYQKGGSFFGGVLNLRFSRSPARMVSFMYDSFLSTPALVWKLYAHKDLRD
jgi:hypothetical protein